MTRNCVGLIFSFRLAARAHSDARAVLFFLFALKVLLMRMQTTMETRTSNLSPTYQLLLPSHASTEPPDSLTFGCAMISPADRN